MKTILLLEDEPGIAEVLVILLEREQFKVVAAANGLEALEALPHAKPDAIVTDVMMPFMNGTDFCKQVRLDPAYAHIPIVFQTAVEEWAVREHFADFDAFFLKPYPAKALVSRLLVLAREGRPAVRDRMGADGVDGDSPADFKALGLEHHPDSPD